MSRQFSNDQSRGDFYRHHSNSSSDRNQSDTKKELSPEQAERLALLEKKVTYAEGRLGPKELEYLTGRGLSEETIRRLRIGVLPDGRYLLPVLRDGQLASTIEHRPGDDPKYMFPSGEHRPLVGAENLGCDGGPVYVVEGWFDWATFEQGGVPAVAVLGRPSADQTTQLRKADDLVLLMDGDEAGRGFAEDLADRLFPRARIADLPDGKDPNDLGVGCGEDFAESIRILANEAKGPLDRGLAVRGVAGPG